MSRPMKGRWALIEAVARKMAAMDSLDPNLPVLPFRGEPLQTRSGEKFLCHNQGSELPAWKLYAAHAAFAVDAVIAVAAKEA